MAKKKTKRAVSSKSASKTSGRRVNWILVLIMSVIFGWVGVDRFIMGKVWTGILKLITLGGLGVWWLVDLILIATKYEFKGVIWDD